LAAELGAAGWRVTGLDRVPVPESAAGPFTEIRTCDLLDDGALGTASVGAYDAIVHLAGVLPGPASRCELFATNVGGPRRC